MKTYTYDALTRLDTVIEPSTVTNETTKTTQYTYDKAGNRQTQTVTESGTTEKTNYSYDAQNRLLNTSALTNNGTTKKTVFSYDNNGNMTLQTVETIKKIDPVNPPKPKFGMVIVGQWDRNLLFVV